jgi:DNA-binding beta-propeller fold protein YncE
VTSTQPGKIGVHPFGDVYVVNEQIEQYAADGTFIGSIGGVDQFGSPMSFAFDPMGDIYVSDMGFRLWKYWLSGYAEQIAALQYYTNQIADIAVNSVSGDIYVLDSKQSRVTRFSQDGSVLSQWETHRSATDRSVEPRGIAVDGNGNIYVSDTGKHRIQKFTKDGVFLTMWGTQGSGNGQFTSPWGIAVDPAGRIYVADYGNNRIQVFQ